MSVDWDAKLILGCKIDNPYVVRKSRGCHHQESESKFCSECGKPMWAEEKVLSPILDEYGAEEGNIRFICTCSGPRYYFGIFLAEVDRRKKDAKVDQKAIGKEVLESMLSRILKDLYKPENFGLWLILDAG